MKKTVVIFVILTLAPLFAFAPVGGLPKEFTALLDRAKMTFDMPNNFKEVKCIANDQVGYDFAIQLKGKDFEVRYIVFPLDSMKAQYEKSLKDTTTKVIKPNNLFASFFLMTVMNASMGANGGMGDAQSFDSEAVKKEFNADDGKVVRFSPGKEFGQDYTTGIMVGLHKDDIGDAYIFFLSHSKDGFTDNMDLAFHALKFK